MVHDKKDTSFESFCSVIYVSKYINLIIVDIETAEMNKLMDHPNVISIHPPREGSYF